MAMESEEAIIRNQQDVHQNDIENNTATDSHDVSSEDNSINIPSYDDGGTKEIVATKCLDVSSDHKNVDVPSDEDNWGMFGDEIAMEKETSVQDNLEEDADSGDNEPVELV